MQAYWLGLVVMYHLHDSNNINNKNEQWQVGRTSTEQKNQMTWQSKETCLGSEGGNWVYRLSQYY